MHACELLLIGGSQIWVVEAPPNQLSNSRIWCDDSLESGGATYSAVIYRIFVATKDSCTVGAVSTPGGYTRTIRITHKKKVPT